MDLEKTLYHVTNDMDEVEVCAVMNMSCDCVDNCHCPLSFPFKLTLTMTGRVYGVPIECCSYCVQHCIIS